MVFVAIIITSLKIFNKKCYNYLHLIQKMSTLTKGINYQKRLHTNNSIRIVICMIECLIFNKLTESYSPIKL